MVADLVEALFVVDRWAVLGTAVDSPFFAADVAEVVAAFTSVCSEYPCTIVFGSRQVEFT